MALSKQIASPLFRILQIGMLALVIGLGIYVRYIDLDSQFTSIDDLGVAESILAQEELYDIAYVRKRIYDSAHSAFNSLPYRTLRKLDAADKLEFSLPLFRQLFKAVVVPWVWTYAPFQFPITSLLISRDQSYKQILFWGRFPSFLFGSLALVLVVLVHRKLNEDNYFFTGCCSLLFLSFAWENIIYAKHMSSYSIGVFAAIALLLILMAAIKKDCPTAKSSAMLGVVLAIISHMQYQALFFMPAFYLALLAARGEKSKSTIASLKLPLITAVTHALLIAPMIVLFLLHRTDRGVTWSRDVSFPIVFDLSLQSTLADKLFYCLEFFSFNFYKIVEFLFALSPFDGSSISANVILIIAMAAGLYKLFTSSATSEKAIGRFFLLSILSIMGLVAIQKLGFGPTRHSLFFFPYMVISASFGLKMFVDLVSRRIDAGKMEMVSAIAIAGIVIMVFLMNFESALRDRRDLFVESEFEGLVQKYKPDFVIDHSAGNLSFMRPVKDWPKQYSPVLRDVRVLRNPVQMNAKIYMLVGYRPFTRGELVTIKNDFKFDTDFDDSSTADAIYIKEASTGACIDVCVERRTGENGIFIQIFGKPLAPRVKKEVGAALS